MRFVLLPVARGRRAASRTARCTAASRTYKHARECHATTLAHAREGVTVLGVTRVAQLLLGWQLQAGKIQQLHWQGARRVKCVAGGDDNVLVVARARY